MHNHGPGSFSTEEKPKSIKKSLIKLFTYLHSYLPIIIIAIILSCAGAICSIVGPNKISDLTNIITDSFVLNEDKMGDVTSSITNELSNVSFAESFADILKLDLSTENMKSIANNNPEDLTILTNISKTHDLKLINDLSDNTKYLILPDSIYQGVIITTADKLTLINLDMSDTTSLMKNLPYDVLASLLTTSTIDSVEITNYDKADYLTIMANVSDDTAKEDILASIDSLPDSIKSLIEPKLDIDAVKRVALLLLILYLVSAIFNFIQGFIMATVSNRFSQNLRSKMSIKINKLPLKYFDSHETGDILSRVTNDIDTINNSMNQSLSTLVGAVTLFIGSIIMMIYTNGTLALTAILSSVIGFVLMGIILGKSQKYFNARQIELGKLNGHIEEIYGAHNVVKAYNGEHDATEKFNKLNESVYDCNLKSRFLSGLMQPLMSFIGDFSYVAVCVVGAMLVIEGHITFGVIVAFMIYIRLFTNPLTQIAQGFAQVQTTMAASERVFEFLESEELKDESNITNKLLRSTAQGNIEFKNVKFGYDDNKIIIKNFNCKASHGKKIAIVGPTGAGKTTLVNLLMKFYNINSGDIIIDGHSIHDLTRENIHDLFVMVLQDTWLFEGTIRDNIKFNKPDVTDEEIWNALETVGVDHFVHSLPDKLDYVLKENDSISSGQKQLLTIARGMIEDKPFLILDEATSSVDTRTEELVQKAMDKLTEGHTSFIIAHRLSTIKNADIILVMNDGNIIEQGNHDELMKLDGFYADLYNSQFQN